MTGEEICVQAERHIENQTIRRILALKVLNEWLQMDLGKEAKIIGSTQITATKNVFADLPADLLEIFEIEKTGLSYPYHGTMYGTYCKGLYDLRNGKIRFPETDVFTVWYYRVPKTLKSLNEKPEVHELLHYPASFYLAAKYLSNYDIQDSLSAYLLNEYQAYKEKALKELGKTFPNTKAPHRVHLGSWS